MASSLDAPITLSEHNGRQHLALTGDVTIDTAAALYQAAQAAARAGQDVGVCCAAAGRLDTAALQILLALKADLTAGGKALRLLAPGPGLTHLLRQSGLAPALLGSTH